MPKYSNTIAAAAFSLGVDPRFLQASLEEMRRYSAVFQSFPPGATLQVRYVAVVPLEKGQETPNSEPGIPDRRGLI